MKKIALSILLLMMFFIVLMLLNSCGDEIITGEYKKYSFTCQNGTGFDFRSTFDYYNKEVVNVDYNLKTEPINEKCYTNSFFVTFCPDLDKMELTATTYNAGSNLIECSGKITEINLD